MEQEKVQNQLDEISTKLNEIENKQEPVIVFRVKILKNVGSSNQQAVTGPGEFSKTLIFKFYDIKYDK